MNLVLPTCTNTGAQSSLSTLSECFRGTLAVVLGSRMGRFHKLQWTLDI
jgi:hypothetical protein